MHARDSLSPITHTFRFALYGCQLRVFGSRFHVLMFYGFIQSPEHVHGNGETLPRRPFLSSTDTRYCHETQQDVPSDLVIGVK